MALLVTEPSLSGIHDLERILGVCHHFNVTALVCINKYDLNEENTRNIEHQCLGEGVEIVGHIPFDNIVTESIVQGIPVVEYSNDRVTHQIEKMWYTLSTMLKN